MEEKDRKAAERYLIDWFVTKQNYEKYLKDGTVTKLQTAGIEPDYISNIEYITQALYYTRDELEKRYKYEMELMIESVIKEVKDNRFGSGFRPPPNVILYSLRLSLNKERTVRNVEFEIESKMNKAYAKLMSLLAPIIEAYKVKKYFNGVMNSYARQQERINAFRSVEHKGRHAALGLGWGESHTPRAPPSSPRGGATRKKNKRRDSKKRR